jgi:hypothetical protein
LLKAAAQLNLCRETTAGLINPTEGVQPRGVANIPSAAVLVPGIDRVTQALLQVPAGPYGPKEDPLVAKGVNTSDKSHAGGSCLGLIGIHRGRPVADFGQAPVVRPGPEGAILKDTGDRVTPGRGGRLQPVMRNEMKLDFYILY